MSLGAARLDWGRVPEISGWMGREPLGQVHANGRGLRNVNVDSTRDQV
jgi:hypothetical protein